MLKAEIKVKVDYEYITTTDTGEILRALRVPLIKTLQKEKLAGRRDILHIKEIHTRQSIEINILIALEIIKITVEVLKLLLRNASRQSREELRRIIKGRRNLRSVRYEGRVEEELVEEFTVEEFKSR